MTFIVMTKWIDAATSFGRAKHPACVITGVTGYSDVTGQDAKSIAAAGYLLCRIVCDQKTADSIESQGLGKVLYQESDKDTPLDAQAASDLSGKLTGFGIDPAVTDAAVKPSQTKDVTATSLVEWIKTGIVPVIDAKAEDGIDIKAENNVDVKVEASSIKGKV